MAYNINTGAIQLGPCKIWYWDTNGYVAVGGTEGGTRINYSPKFFDLKIDQTGETIVKKILQGEEASIAFGIAESGFEKLQLAIPFGTIYSNAGNTAYGVGVNSGGDLLNKSLKLKVHPINTRGAGGVDDESYIDDDFTIWMAGNADAVEIPYTNDAPRTYNVTMAIFPDFDQDAGRYLFVIGDTAISADSTPPDVNKPTIANEGCYPLDDASGVAITVVPKVVMSEVVRELSGGDINGIVKLVKDDTVANTHTNVDIGVGFEQYIMGVALASTATTLDLATDEISQDDQLNGLYIEITDGTGAGDDLVAITDSATANNRVTVAAWINGTPDITSRYKIHGSRVTITPTASLTAAKAHNILIGNMIDRAGNIQTDIFESSFETA